MINRIIAIAFLIFMGTTCAVFFVIACIIWLFTILFDQAAGSPSHVYVFLGIYVFMGYAFLVRLHHGSG